MNGFSCSWPVGCESLNIANKELIPIVFGSSFFGDPIGNGVGSLFNQITWLSCLVCLVPLAKTDIWLTFYENYL